jgi:putative hemolysin
MSKETQQLAKDFKIDIEKVIEDKNPHLKKLLPGFMISYLKRIVHQDDVNYFINTYYDKEGIDFIKALLGEMNTTVKTINLEKNIPKEDKVIVTANHPLGGLDGLALMLAVGRVRSDIQFPVNDILTYIPNLKVLFIPVNKHGSNAENIRLFNETFEKQNIICYFPAGLVSRKQNGKIMDLEWKKTIITKAKRYKRDIIPTYIEGNNSKFFYNLALYRKKLGIKANLEMFYLSDEFFKQRNKTLTITFGPRISYKVFDKRHKDVEWAQLLKEHVYKLKEKPDLEFNP